jgi:hypothetical protein
MRTSSTSRTEDTDWIGLATLDASTGVSHQTSGRGSAYLDGRTRFTHWTGSEEEDGRQVSLTYYDPEWMSGVQEVIERPGAAEAMDEDPPVGLTLNADKGSSGLITISEALDAGLPNAFVSPDDRWALKVEGNSYAGAAGYGLALVDRGVGGAVGGGDGGRDGESEPVWRLRGNWCNDVRWAP